MFKAPVSDLDEGGFTAPPEDLSGGFNAPAEDLAPQSEIPQLKPWNPTLLDRLQQFGQNIRQSGPVESLLGPTDQEKAGQPVASNSNRISTEGLLGALSSDEKTTALGESAANLLKTVSSNQPQNIILDHVAKLGGVVGGSAQVAQGIHDAVLDFVGHMAVDPRNYLLGMGFLSKYPALARTVSGVFGAQMAAQVPAAAQAAGAASVDGTPREQAAAYANLGISTAFPLLAGVHATHGETAPTVNHLLPGQFKPAAALDNSEPFSTPNADAILSQNKGAVDIVPIEPISPPVQIQPTPNRALQIPQAGTLLQQQPSETPITGSERGGVEPSQQRIETPAPSAPEAPTAQEPVAAVNALTPSQVADLRSKVFDNLRGPQEFAPADFAALDTHLKKAIGPETPSVAQMQQVGVLNVTPLENGKMRVEPTTPQLPPTPKGEQVVTIQRPDGTTYPASYGGKSWQGVGPNGEDIPIIDRIAGDSWSHGILARGEKILNDPFAKAPEPQPSNPPISAPVEVKTIGEVSTPKSPLHDFVNRAFQKMADEAKGQHMLDTLGEEGKSPKAVVEEFWNNTYPILPEHIQRKFQNYIRKETGFELGDVVATQNGEKIYGKTWPELYPSEQAGESVENLEGTERGLISLMETANRNRDIFKSNQLAAPVEAGMAGEAAPKPDTITIYRAGGANEVGVKPFSSWSEDESSAKAYQDNPGFGGPKLRRATVEKSQILDADIRTRSGMDKLASELGFDSGTGETWVDNGWQYPWEESKKVKTALEESGYDFIRYTDDFPQGSKTLVPLKKINEIPDNPKEIPVPIQNVWPDGTVSTPNPQIKKEAGNKMGAMGQMAKPSLLRSQKVSALRGRIVQPIESGIVETDAAGNYISKEKDGTYKVWQAGATASKLAGTIGYKGAAGLAKARERLARIPKTDEQRQGALVGWQKHFDTSTDDFYKKDILRKVADVSNSPTELADALARLKAIATDGSYKGEVAHAIAENKNASEATRNDAKAYYEKLFAPEPPLKESVPVQKEPTKNRPEDTLLENLYSKLAKAQPDRAAKGFVVIEGKQLRNARDKAAKTAESIGFGRGIETFESPLFSVRKIEVSGVDQYAIHKNEKSIRHRAGDSGSGSVSALHPNADSGVNIGNIVQNSLKQPELAPTAIPKPVEGVKEPLQSEGGQTKPVEPVKPAPVTPEAKQPTALETINTSPKVSVKLPEGATMVRTTIKYKDREIQKVISKKDLEKFNPFAGSENVKLEAGTIRSGGMFSPVRGKVEVRAKESPKPTTTFAQDENKIQSTEALAGSKSVRDLRDTNALISLVLDPNENFSELQRASAHNIKPVEGPIKQGASGLEADAATWRAIAKSFSVRVVTLDMPEAFSGTHGITTEKMPGVLFVNARTSRAFHAIVGHELLHDIQNRNPQLYIELFHKIKSLVKDPEFSEFITAKQRSGITDPNVIREELVADLFERSFNEPSFWNKLAAKEPKFFEKLATVVIDFLNRLTQKLHDNGVYKYFTDVGKAHDAIAQTLADFKRLQGESGKSSGTGTVTFSRDENVDPSMEDFIKSTVAPSDEQAFHQTPGVPNLGTEYKPERIQATREAVQQTRFTAEGPITEAKVGEFYRLLQEFTDKPTRRQAMDSLVADVKAHTGDETGELAPALLYAELRDFAAKMLLRGDVTPLFKIRSLSNEFATIAGEVTSAGARAMRGLQEGEGKTLLKSLYELTKTRLKEEGQKLGVSDELYQQLVDSLDNAEVDKKGLENAIATGKNTEGQTIDDILGTAKPEEVVKTKPEREKRAKQELDSDAEKSAKKIINDLQLKRGAEWLKPEVPRGRVDEIKEFAKNYLKGRLPDDPLKDPMNPEDDYQRPQPGSTLSDIEARKVADELEKLGVTPNSAIVLAHELIQEREVKFGNERLKQMRQAANSRSVKSLVESILGTPLRAQSDPAWVKATAMHWFMDNGLSREQADAAYRIFNKQFQSAFVRAQEKIAKSILKSGEAKTLDAVVKQIRSGLFDPSHPGFEPFSAKIGLKGMPKADLEKLAELDEKLSKGLKSMPEVVMTTDHMLAILRRNKLPPSVLKTFAANYSISQLSGIRTMTIHAFAGVAHLLHERVLATLSQWPTADNLSILWKPVARAAKDFVDQLRFGWGAGHSYFPMRELEAGEDVLRQQFEQGAKEFKSGSLKERSVGALRMLSGVQNFTMRLLNALNQANIIAVRDAQLPLFGSMAFKELGLNPKQIAAIIDVLPSFRNAAYTDAIDRGFSPLHARVIAHDIEQEYLADFFGQTARSPELKAALKKGATYEGLSIVGRLAKGVKEQEEGGILSRYGGLHALIRITGQMSHTPEGRIGKLYMFGYVAVPTRMARFEAWNSAYGLLRLGIDKIQRTHGWESWWKQSLATKQQREYRLRMALAATAVQGLLLGGLVAGGAALLGRRSTADPDAGKDKFAWYITGNGPQNKDLRDAWSHMGFQSNSIVLALNGKVHVAIPITRVGETLGHMLWGYSAADDYAWRKKEAEAHGKIDPATGAYVPGKFNENSAVTAFQAIGNYASIIGERGPLQTVLQMGRGNESSQIALASAPGKLLAPAVPFAGLQRSVRDMIVGQVDYSTPESAFEANFPVLGWTGSTQAINRLGDPLYDHSWYAKIARTGLPIAVGVADTSENQQLYTAILNQGVAIPALSRTRVEDEYGQLTQDQWNQFAKTSGTTLKSSLLSNLNTLQNTDPADARKLVSINANAADATAARSMGLEKQSSSRSSGATASAAPSSGLPRQTRPNSLRSGLRPHSRVHRLKLNHAGRMTSGLRHRTGSLLRNRRRSAYA